jgi:hypothetical protein
MSFLVFWYGSIEPSSAYSFLTATNVKEYDVKLDNFSPELKKKIDSGKGRLTKQEEYMVRGFEEMHKDLAKRPEDRPKTEFKELHEIEECPMHLGSERVDVELISDSSDDEDLDKEDLSLDVELICESSDEEDLDKEDLKPATATKSTRLPERVATEGVADEKEFAEDEVSGDDSKDEEAPPFFSEDEEEDLDLNDWKVRSKTLAKKIGKRAIQRKRTTPKKEGTVDTKPKKEATEEESIEPQDMEESRVAPKHSYKRNADDKSPQEKPKARKPKRDSSEKKKSPKTRVAVSSEELEKAREVARRDFETEKARILGEVPEEHKAKWGQVGFGKWNTRWEPCLILGPYDVSPTSAMRENWLKMFDNVSAQFLTWYPFLVLILRCEPKYSQFQFSFLLSGNRDETQCHS